MFHVCCVTLLAVLCAGQPQALSPDTSKSPKAITRFHVDEIVLRGLEYIYGHGLLNDENFAKYGHDYLLCVDGVLARTTNPIIQHRAQDIARALGRKWKKIFSEVPEDVNAAELMHLMFGVFALERIGLPFRTLSNELRQAMPHFESSEFLHFNPDDDAPGANFPLPDSHPFRELVNTQEIAWYGSLVHAYMAQKLRLPLGDRMVQYVDVLKHIRSLRPYKPLKNHTSLVQSNDQLYAIANLVWTLSDYGTLRLDPEKMSQEYQWFIEHLPEYLALKDVTAVAVIVDALKLFGEGVDDDAHKHALNMLASAGPADSNLLEQGSGLTADAIAHMKEDMQKAISFILESQNANGSWGRAELGEQDAYHPTCAALYALTEHSHKGYGPSIPAAAKLVHSEL